MCFIMKSCNFKDMIEPTRITSCIKTQSITMAKTICRIKHIKKLEAEKMVKIIGKRCTS